MLVDCGAVEIPNEYIIYIGIITTAVIVKLFGNQGIYQEHFRRPRYAHVFKFVVGLHGTQKFHPIVKYEQISSGARASLEVCIENTN